MILFFSDHCPYSRTLLDEIKRRDTNGDVKLVSIETLKASKRPIPSVIHSVPALMILPNKEVLFGRAVFDYLFLPRSGRLDTTTSASTSASASTSTSTPSVLQGQMPLPNDDPFKSDEPHPFTLNTGLSEAFTFLDGPELADGNDAQKNYGWSVLTEKETSLQPTNVTNITNPLNNVTLQGGDALQYNPNVPGVAITSTPGIVGANRAAISDHMSGAVAPMETRRKKEITNMDNLQSEREMAQKNYSFGAPQNYLNGNQLPHPSATR